jgi:hypothetical protein
MYRGPGRYQHRKGGTYRVLGISRNKRTGERCVVYQSLNIAQSALSGDDFWSRPIDDFNAVVDGVERFRHLSSHETSASDV